MSPLRSCLTRVSRLPILYQNRRLCHQNPAAQHNADLETERRVLPEELMKNVVRLTCKSTAEPGVCDVYVVGVTHGSQDSIREVQAIVNFLKPQVVSLELCPSRRAFLFSTKIVKIGAKLEVLSDSEFGIAYHEASKYGGKVVLGDRPIEVTVQRTRINLPLWQTTKSIFEMIWRNQPLWQYRKRFFQSSASEAKMMKKLEDNDTITFLVQELIKHFPTWAETNIYERDRYMSCTLLKVAKEHNLVVAVVGRTHLQGIKKNWEQPVSLEELLEVPERKRKLDVSDRIISGVAIVGLVVIAWQINLRNKG